MIGSFKAEWRKLVRRPAVMISGAILLVLVILVGYVIPYLIDTHAGTGYRSGQRLSAAQQLTALYPDVLVQQGLGLLARGGAVLALVFGALVAGSEYGWGTLKAVFTQRPRRLQVLAGRAAAVAVSVGVMTVLYWIAAAAGSVAVALLQGHAITWPSGVTLLEGAGATFLILGVWSMIGMALGFLLRSAPAAIGIGIAYVLGVEGLVFTLLAPLGGSTLTSIEKFFPGPNVTAVIDSFGSALPVPAAAPLVGVWQGVAVLAAYFVVIAALAAAVVHRRDLI